MRAKTKEDKLPSSLAACADLLYTTREQRLKQRKEVDRLAKLESRLEQHFVDQLSKDSRGIAGRFALVQIKPKTIPTVADWEKFYAYVKRTGSFDLMQKRLATKAVEERWEAKKEVPGVQRFNVKKVSCTLLKGAKQV